MQVNVNPCPHCGGEARVSSLLPQHSEVKVFCPKPDCLVKGAYVEDYTAINTDKAVREWNALTLPDMEITLKL